MDKIFDSIHGFIHFDELEKLLIESWLFQRLHHIRQVGLAYFVYPGARHSRFEHSLGVMHLASKIFDRLPHKLSLDEHKFWRAILRLGALCHDLGHLPFSHVAEQTLLGEEGHELWTCKIIGHESLAPFWQKVEIEFGIPAIRELIVKVAVGKKKLTSLKDYAHITFTPWEELISSIVTGDFFGADRIDYLVRDAHCTGVSYGLFDFHQLIESLSIGPDLILGVEEAGIEACEALLLARYFMYRRVYRHNSVKAYNFHLCRFLKTFVGPHLKNANIEHYLALSESKIITAIDNAINDTHHPGHLDALAIYDKNYRYRCIGLREKPDAIASEQELEHIQGKESQEFPVIKKSGAIASSKEFTNISCKEMGQYFIYTPPSRQTFKICQ